MTALATAGFLVSAFERRISEAHATSVNAFQAARAGLETFLGEEGEPEGTTRTFSFPDGSAVVTGTRLLTVDSGRVLLLVASDGSAGPSARRGARRYVRLVALLRDRYLRPPAALASAVGITVPGTPDEISGFDAAAPGECPAAPAPATAGIAVPTGGYENPGASTAAVGSPDIQEAGSAIELFAGTGLDWPALAPLLASEAEVTVMENEWPDFSLVGPGRWPLIAIPAKELSLGPAHSGNGTIVALGDLTLESGFEWRGVILVGGRLSLEGPVVLEGTAAGGLNALGGEVTEQTWIVGAGAVIRYQSCAVAAALDGWPFGLAEVPGSRYESFGP